MSYEERDALLGHADDVLREEIPPGISIVKTGLSANPDAVLPGPMAACDGADRKGHEQQVQGDQRSGTGRVGHAVLIRSTWNASTRSISA